MSIIEDYEEESKAKCVMCERGLAIFGILVGTVFLAISIHTLVMSLREGEVEE